MLYQNINNNSKIKSSQLYLSGIDLNGGEKMDVDLGKNNSKNDPIFAEMRQCRIDSLEITEVSEWSGSISLHRNTVDTVLIAGSHPEIPMPDCGRV